MVFPILILLAILLSLMVFPTMVLSTMFINWIVFPILILLTILLSLTMFLIGCFLHRFLRYGKVGVFVLDGIPVDVWSS